MTQALTSRLILASGSPRRRQLLADAGMEFGIIGPKIPEPCEFERDLPPRGLAEALAYFKARAVADENPDATVLGADTIVAGPLGVVGKPGDADVARDMLRTLSGTRHEVITGVAVLAPPSRRLIASDVTYVTMRPMSEDELEQYIASGEWKDKAGAYAIQETADRFVERLEGSFSNVVGLPMELTLAMLAEMHTRGNQHQAI